MKKKLYSYYFNGGPQPFDDKRCLFTRLGFTYSSLLVDRFNYLNQFSKFYIEEFKDELPSYRPDLSYEDICLARAKYFIDNYPDGIAVAYSGGVDSTGVICALLMAGFTPKKIHLLCNSYSIKENPGFFSSLCANGAKVTVANDLQLTEHMDGIPERVILFGGCNDQLYHVGSVYRHLDKQTIPLNDSLKWWYERKDMLEYLDQDIEIYRKYSELLNWEVKDLFDLSVLINFGCRYVFIQDHVKLQSLNPDTRAKIVQFFDNQDFQDWGYTFRHQNKEQWRRSIKDNSYYKRFLKDLILKIYPNKSYYANKGKEGSWKKSMRNDATDRNTLTLIGVHDAKGYHVSALDRMLKYDDKAVNRVKKVLLGDYIKDEFFIALC